MHSEVDPVCAVVDSRSDFETAIAFSFGCKTSPELLQLEREQEVGDEDHDELKAMIMRAVERSNQVNHSH